MIKKRPEDEKVAVLTIPGDKKDLARGINELLDDDKKRKKLGEKARKRAVEKFDWSVVSNKLLEKFQELIKNR